MLEVIVSALVIVLAIIIGPDLLERLDGSMSIFVLVMAVIFVLPALLVGAYEEDYENSVKKMAKMAKKKTKKKSSE